MTLKAVIVGIDLAGTPDNPTGWAAWKNKNITVCQLYTQGKVELVENSKEGFIAVPTREDWRKLKL